MYILNNLYFLILAFHVGLCIDFDMCARYLQASIVDLDSNAVLKLKFDVDFAIPSWCNCYIVVADSGYLTLNPKLHLETDFSCGSRCQGSLCNRCDYIKYSSCNSHSCIEKLIEKENGSSVVSTFNNLEFDINNAEYHQVIVYLRKTRGYFAMQVEELTAVMVECQKYEHPDDIPSPPEVQIAPELPIPPQTEPLQSTTATTQQSTQTTTFQTTYENDHSEAGRNEKVDENERKDDIQYIAIGVTVAVVATACIVVVIVIVLLKRRKGKQKDNERPCNEPTNPYQAGYMTNVDVNLSNVYTRLAKREQQLVTEPGSADGSSNNPYDYIDITNMGPHQVL